MNKERILECCSRYLTRIEQEEGKLGDFYLILIEWLRKNCEDENLRHRLMVYMRMRTVKVIIEHDLNCKFMAKGKWNSDAVKVCYQKLRELNKAEADMGFNTQPSKRVVSLTTEFVEYAEKYSMMPIMQLYFYVAFCQRESGRKLLDYYCNNNLESMFKEDEDA